MNDKFSPQVMTHEGVYGIIQKNNQILLVKKNRGPYLGLFDLPGGRIEAGETIDEALVREIREETGIQSISWSSLTEFEHIGDYVVSGKHIKLHHKGVIYQVTSFDDSQINLNIHCEDVNGAIWHRYDHNISMTPFANRCIPIVIKNSEICERQ
jgi:8-oxo-dGTP diphosphatase